MSNKESYTFGRQIDLLRNRGLIIQDEQNALRYLSRISYYRLKGYWWDMQSDTTKHLFEPNHTFEEVIRIYEFDKELRHICFDAIESIEIALRTQMIYWLSQEYGGLWYLNSELFEDQTLYSQHLHDLFSEFNRSKELFVKDYRMKHPNYSSKSEEWDSDEYPDAWIILEVATFGNLSKIYKNLKHQLPAKSRIANGFGLNMSSELSSWLEAISYLRNVIAHHSRLWNRTVVKKPMNISSAKFPWLNILTEYQQKRPYSVISTMLYLCNAIDAECDFKDRLYDLFERYNDVPIYKIGFVSGWQCNPIWKK